MQSEKMLHYASKTADGKSDYFSYCVREKRNIAEVFTDFWVTNQIPLSYLIQGIGRQKPREFSISSAFNG
jgi:sulfite reductase alpha subunit-like flavoprotein